MKIKYIIVDEVPKECKNCCFGHRPLTADDGVCDLDWNAAVDLNFCPLITENQYLKSTQ